MSAVEKPSFAGGIVRDRDDNVDQLFDIKDLKKRIAVSEHKREPCWQAP